MNVWLIMLNMTGYDMDFDGTSYATDTFVRTMAWAVAKDHESKMQP